MAKLLKLRRGTTSQHSSFTGAEGEVTVDTDKEALVVHNGSTAGGFPVARADGTGTTNFTITGELDAATGDFSGDVDIDGTLEADAITVNGTALNTVIAGVTVTNATNAVTATNFNLTANNSADETVYPVFVDAATGSNGGETDTGFTYNPSTGKLTATEFVGNIDAVDGDFDGTLEADAITVGGTALGTVIAGTTVTNATNAAHVSVADNESTDENNLITFIENASATGNVGLESDGDFHYNPSTGLLSVGALTLTGNLTVGGTTTTVNSTTLTVDDKNIELGSVDTPSDTTADGGGITLKGASDKEIKWVNSTDNWTFNQNIEVTSGSVIVKGGEGADAVLDIVSDEGDDDGDWWRIYAAFSDNDLYFKNKTSGSYVTKAKITEEGVIEDALGNIRDIPENATTSGYTLVAGDAGKCVTNTSGGVTVPYNTLATGDAVTIVNHSGSNITITQGSNMTLYNAADAATGNRTLAGRGMATVWYQAQNLAYISGAGLT